MKNYKVSIIIPVYNVEKYIRCCIKSLLNQTYSNCEFIFVNDGSYDNSVSVINEYLEIDSRIKVVSQKNNGVSSARNTGLSHSSGDYIIFVDADDYVAKDFVEYMVDLITNSDSDFAFSTQNFQKKKETQQKKEYIKHITSDESCALLLSPAVTVGCWNKIYKRTFLKKHNIQFNTKLYYGEGLQFIIDASLNARKICVGNRKVYFYRKNNTNSATTKFSIEKICNGEKSLELIRHKINLSNPNVKAMYVLHLTTFYLAALVRMNECKEIKKYRINYKKWRKEIFKNVPFLVFSKYVGIYRKSLIFFGVLSPKFVSILDNKRRKLIYKNSV